MKFWKEHVRLRVILMLAAFVSGITLTVIGWHMTGDLAGLGIMLIGVFLLTATLYLYNKPFETPKIKKGERK